MTPSPLAPAKVFPLSLKLVVPAAVKGAGPSKVEELVNELEELPEVVCDWVLQVLRESVN